MSDPLRYGIAGLIVLVILVVVVAFICGMSEPDPASWRMDPDVEAEYDRLAAGEAYLNAPLPRSEWNWEDRAWERYVKDNQLMAQDEYDRRYREGLTACYERYKQMLSDAMWNQRVTHVDNDKKLKLSAFIKLFGHHVWDDPLPLPKLCRWLGNIQGKLDMMGVTSDEVEREWTRSLFRPLDFPDL